MGIITVPGIRREHLTTCSRRESRCKELIVLLAQWLPDSRRLLFRDAKEKLILFFKLLYILPSISHLDRVFQLLP